MREARIEEITNHGGGRWTVRLRRTDGAILKTGDLEDVLVWAKDNSVTVIAAIGLASISSIVSLWATKGE